MRPAVSVLQLDTTFPRVAGDVACAQTYLSEIEIIRIPSATVAQVVTGKPETINITPFEAASQRAKGDVVVTSCGFLSYWQAHLAAQCKKPFISSSLIALERLAQDYSPDELLIVTFDADSLNAAHLGAFAAYARSIIGLPEDNHLRRVISGDLSELETERACQEISDFVAAHITPKHRHILHECTNLPPYKAALRARTGVPVSDILTLIERARAGSVSPDFL